MQGGVRQKRCERCGRVFSCGLSRCWCSTVHLTEEQYQWIARHYVECLCPDCLEEVRTGRLGEAKATQAAATEPPAPQSGPA